MDAELGAESPADIRGDDVEALRIDQVTQYITSHTAPNEPIFVVPWAAGFYFLTDRPNPTRVDLFFDGNASSYPCLIAAMAFPKTN